MILNIVEANGARWRLGVITPLYDYDWKGLIQYHPLSWITLDGQQ